MKTTFGCVLLISLLACEVSPVDQVFVDRGRPSVDAGGGSDVTIKEACVTAPRETDPLAYPACACAKGGAARCVPAAGIPTGLASQLETCSGGACVPETIIRSGGAAPKTCESPFGEGRCVSLCVPAVADNASALDRGKGAVCADDERCVPCKNPLANGASTGVCEVGAAPPATCETPAEKSPVPALPVADAEAPKALAACCEGHGRCVPRAVVPESARDALDDDDGACVEDQELCVPEELVSPATPPRTCTVSLPFVGTYQGICVSDCFDALVPSGNCPGDLVCAPKQ